jgi:hypothetical protein
VGGGLRADEPALLLEGSWPDRHSPRRWSLDDSIDASCGWIDDEASRMAHALAMAELGGIEFGDTAERPTSNVQRPTSNDRRSPPLLDVGRSSSSGPTPAYVNELKLRYYLVKLLRVVAFYEIAQEPGSSLLCGKIELVAAHGRDEDYADLLGAIAGAHGLQLQVTWRDGCTAQSASAPPNRWWRRAAAAVSSWTNPSWPADHSPRIFLCGSRRVLGRICDELVSRQVRVAWVYERFAVQTWLRWRSAGVAQLVCHAAGDAVTPSRMDFPSVRLSCRGIELAAPVTRWLTRIHHQQGLRQARLWQSLNSHFSHWRPSGLVLDEDATPMARAAIAVARRHSVPSVVMQHGVPRVKFGFAPLAADYFFAWGESSRRQMAGWGVPPERIRMGGWPGGMDRTSNDQRSTSNIRRGVRRTPGRLRRPEILLFATTPPRDDRPDAVTFHLTGRTYRQMLWMAFAAVASITGARLTIKLHPRCRDGRMFRTMAAEFPCLPCRIVRRGSMARLVDRAACIINCTSSAGVEAARLGAKVIELIPEGSLDLLPAGEWNGLGTARTEPELRQLLCSALNAVPTDATDGDHEHVFAAVSREAARRVVDELLSIAAKPEKSLNARTVSSSSSSSSSSKSRAASLGSALRGRGRGRGRGRARHVAANNARP